MAKELQKISTKHLQWTPDKRQKQVLLDISTNLYADRFYGILGPNGAGKTSFVRQLLGLLESSSGTVFLDEKNIRHISRREIAQTLSFLPQNLKSDVDFSVFDVVAMGREVHRKHFSPLNETDLKKIEEAMEFTNCSHLREKSIAFLSGGERQRVMIARTIAQDTPWIILDEPVSSLDVKHQAELMQVLERLRGEKGKTIVAILHDLNLAAEFCTHLVFMKKGTIYREGEKNEVLSREILKEVYGMDFEFLQHGQRKIIVPCFRR